MTRGPGLRGLELPLTLLRRQLGGRGGGAGVGWGGGGRAQPARGWRWGWGGRSAEDLGVLRGSRGSRSVFGPGSRSVQGTAGGRALSASVPRDTAVLPLPPLQSVAAPPRPRPAPPVAWEPQRRAPGGGEGRGRESREPKRGNREGGRGRAEGGAGERERGGREASQGELGRASKEREPGEKREGEGGRHSHAETRAPEFH